MNSFFFTDKGIESHLKTCEIEEQESLIAAYKRGAIVSGERLPPCDAKEVAELVAGHYLLPGKPNSYFDPDYYLDRLNKRPSPIARQPLDLEQLTQTCPACKTTFSIKLRECPDCGLCIA